MRINPKLLNRVDCLHRICRAKERARSAPGRAHGPFRDADRNRDSQKTEEEREDDRWHNQVGPPGYANGSRPMTTNVPIRKGLERSQPY
eukprot:gene5337-biopygen1682